MHHKIQLISPFLADIQGPHRQPRFPPQAQTLPAGLQTKPISSATLAKLSPSSATKTNSFENTASPRAYGNRSFHSVERIELYK